MTVAPEMETTDVVKTRFLKEIATFNEKWRASHGTRISRKVMDEMDEELGLLCCTYTIKYPTVFPKNAKLHCFNMGKGFVSVVPNSFDFAMWLKSAMGG